MTDAINSPAHYTRGNIEVIDFIEDQGFGYHLGNAVKYISRAGHKDSGKAIEDLGKAVWYINREIARQSSSARRGRVDDDEDVTVHVTSSNAVTGSISSLVTPAQATRA